MAVSKASLRGLRMNERIQKMREAQKEMQKTVKVTPKTDVLRKLLKHPRAGGFPKDGAAEWPDDSFTQRRERDGDITVAREGEHHEPKHRRKHEEKREDSSAA
jgi:hypothetical protein